MPYQPRKTRLVGLRARRFQGLRIKIETTHFFHRKTSNQSFSSFRSFEPLPLEHDKIHRMGEDHGVEILWTNSGIAPRPIDYPFRAEPRILPSRGPGERPEVQVLPVDVEGVQKVARCLPASQREKLVCRSIPEVYTPPELRIGLGREEAECAVHHPIDFRFRSSASNDALKHGWRLHQRLDLVPEFTQCGRIALHRHAGTFQLVVEDVHIALTTGRCGCLMDYAPSGDEAFRSAICGKNTEHFAFEQT